MKKILLLPVLLLSLLALTGCSTDETRILSSGEEALVWHFTENGCVEIEVTPSDAETIEAISGKGLTEALDELFGPAESTEITPGEWAKRKGMLALVRRETGAESDLEVFLKFGDRLSGTEFMEIMDGLSGPFDEKALSKMLRRKGSAKQYGLGAVLSHDSSWPETMSFIGEWTKQISLKDNLKQK